MKVVLSHSGKQHSYHVARSLLKADRLDTFYTSSYITPEWLQNYLIKTDNQFWNRRFLPGLSGKHVNANWRYELKEVILRKLYGKSHKVQNAIFDRDTSFDNYVAIQLHKHTKANAFWGFQGSCHKSLQTAKSLGKTAICELATAHVTAAHKILGEEAKLHPEWADSIDNFEFPAAYQKRLEEEPHIADVVIAASGFTRQTLLNDGVAANKIKVLPLGFDIDYISFKEKEGNIFNRPVKLLYAGTVTQRKGIKYLLEAMKSFDTKEVELHIIGGIQGSGKAFENYKGLYHYHQPVSQQELFAKYADFDALVLPTIFEGFGLVIVEAMAAGLPVISTSHSIAAELIDHKENGYLLPVRSIESIVEAIRDLRNKDQDEFVAMQYKAYSTVKAYSWKAYVLRLEECMSSIYHNLIEGN